MFRGFESSDGGTTWQPVFRLKGEPDPIQQLSTKVEPKKNGAKRNLADDPNFNEVGPDSDVQKKNLNVSREFNQDGGEVDNCKVADESLKNSDESEKKESEKDENSSMFPEEKELEPEKQKQTSDTFDMDIDDEFCSSFEGHLQDDSDAFNFDYGLEQDDDEGSEDDKEFTYARLQNKIARYGRRNSPDSVVLAELPSNQRFIEDFVSHIRKTSTTQNAKSSTINLSTALLFRHDDSFLAYMNKKNPGFSLDQLLCFKDESRFVQLTNPDGWIGQISGSDGRLNPVRRKEMYKAYKRLVLFVMKHLSDQDFGSDLLSILRKDKLKSNLKDISEEINSSKTWSNLQSLIDQERKEKLRAKNIVHPDEKHNVVNANKIYFKSQPFKNRVVKVNGIWKTCMDSSAIGSRDFDTLGNFPRHLLCMTDRNRAAGYHFRNSDFDARKPVWFPPGHNAVKFDGLPDDGWNMYEEPADKREPDAWVMDLSGSEEIVKLGEDVNITILKVVHDFMLKYRDAKGVKWDDVRDDEYFFVNHKRKRFGPLNNTAQLREYQEVTKVSNVTVNTFRRAMEPVIQSDHAMKTRSKDISSHSVQTGAKFYDNSAQEFRASAMHFINAGDGETVSQSQPSVPEEVVKKRRKLDQEGLKSSLEKAKLKLAKDPARRKVTLGKNCKVPPPDRLFMQESFSDGGIFSELKLHDGKFPG